MVKRVLIFLALVLAWVALLWFVLVPDFTKWSWPGAMAVHGGPPLLVLAGWWGWRAWRQRHLAAAVAARTAADREQAAATLAAARQRHDAEVAEQRRYCECRSVALSQVSRTTSGDPGFALGGGNFLLSDVLTPPIPLLGGGWVEALHPALEEALGHVYGQCPAALRFPLYLVPPANAVGEEVLALVRSIHAELAPEGVGLAGAYFLPTGDYVANTVRNLFRDAVWPGAVLLAFDAPWLAPAAEGGAVGEAAVSEEVLWRGHPGQGVFALLLTRPGLNAELEAMAGWTGGQDYDAMTPYWKKEAAEPGDNPCLARLSPGEREQLVELPVLARIHRGHGASLEACRQRPRDLVTALQSLVEKARLSAGMVDSPFVTGGEGDTAPPEEAQPLVAVGPECTWVVHNAGGVERSGQRVASLGLALLNQGIEVDPIDAATNVTVQGGDWGQARSVGLLAMAVARVAVGAEAVLAVDYPGDAEVALGFVVAAAPGA